MNPADNQVYVKSGSHSMALGIDASQSGEVTAVWENSASVGDLTYFQNGYVSMWVYFSSIDYLHPSAGYVFSYGIGSSGSAAAYIWKAKSDLSQGWNYITLDLDNPSVEWGTIDWANISYQRIYIGEAAGNTNDFTLYVDSVTAYL
jgi:hypothetical protein